MIDECMQVLVSITQKKANGTRFQFWLLAFDYDATNNIGKKLMSEYTSMALSCVTFYALVM